MRVLTSAASLTALFLLAPTAAAGSAVCWSVVEEDGPYWIFSPVLTSRAQVDVPTLERGWTNFLSRTFGASPTLSRCAVMPADAARAWRRESIEQRSLSGRRVRTVEWSPARGALSGAARPKAAAGDVSTDPIGDLIAGFGSVENASERGSPRSPKEPRRAPGFLRRLRRR